MTTVNRTNNDGCSPSMNYGGTTDNLGTVRLAFRYINAYKRHRTLAEDCRRKGDMNGAIYNELKQYKNIDGLELALRAIQRGLRDLSEVGDEDD